jgi:NAD(P)H-flavin reductase
VVGKTTLHLSLLQEGECLENCVGPLGNPTEIRRFGRVVCIGGGTGIACLWPILKALKDAGNEVVTIIGARTAELLILEKEIRQASSDVFITTDDGTRGEKGLVTDVLTRLLNTPGNSVSLDIQRVIAIGPPRMMKKVAEITRPFRIKTIVSLNTIMVDGTGMCGSCRVFLGKMMKLACIDGPEFDAHQVNFEDVISRLEMFRQKERLALEAYQQELRAKREISEERFASD